MFTRIKINGVLAIFALFGFILLMEKMAPENVTETVIATAVGAVVTVIVGIFGGESGKDS